MGELGAPIQTDRNKRRLVNRRSAGIRKITNGRKRAVGGAKRTTNDFISRQVFAASDR